MAIQFKLGWFADVCCLLNWPFAAFYLTVVFSGSAVIFWSVKMSS